MLYGAVGLLCFCTPLLGQGPASDRRKPYGIEVKEKSMAKASYMYIYVLFFQINSLAIFSVIQVNSSYNVCVSRQ